MVVCITEKDAQQGVTANGERANGIRAKGVNNRMGGGKSTISPLIGEKEKRSTAREEKGRSRSVCYTLTIAKSGDSAKASSRKQGAQEDEAARDLCQSGARVLETSGNRQSRLPGGRRREKGFQGTSERLKGRAVTGKKE